MNLRVNNFNFDACILTVHDGKGKKERTAPLPETIPPELKAHLELVKHLYQMDLDANYSSTFLPARMTPSDGFYLLGKSTKIAQRNWSGNGFSLQRH